MDATAPRRAGDVPEVRIEVPASHPAFQGHFPGDPVLPGVVLLDAVLALLRDRLGRGTWFSAIPALRWRHPVRPGDVLQACVGAPAPDGRVAFELFRGELAVANGSVRLGERRP